MTQQSSSSRFVSVAKALRNNRGASPWNRCRTHRWHSPVGSSVDLAAQVAPTADGSSLTALSHSPFLDQRAWADSSADSVRSAALRRSARTAPPLLPPARPARASALSCSCGASSVASPTIAAARRFKSAGFFDCFAIDQRVAPAGAESSSLTMKRPGSPTRGGSQRIGPSNSPPLIPHAPASFTKVVQSRAAPTALKQRDLGPVDARPFGDRLLTDVVVVEPRHQEPLPERLRIAHPVAGSREWA